MIEVKKIKTTSKTLEQVESLLGKYSKELYQTQSQIASNPLIQKTLFEVAIDFTGETHEDMDKEIHFEVDKITFLAAWNGNAIEIIFRRNPKVNIIEKCSKGDKLKKNQLKPLQNTNIITTMIITIIKINRTCNHFFCFLCLPDISSKFSKYWFIFVYNLIYNLVIQLFMILRELKFRI